MLDRLGVLAAIIAYTSWGFFPMYWHYLTHINSLETMSHRVIWSFAFYVGVTMYRKNWKDIPKLKTQFALLCGASVLISANWLLYVWAVTHGHVMESSLGYFINPLISVTLGSLVLKEKLNTYQKWALVFATGGVIWLTLDYGRPPWIALGLAFSFAAYGFIKKKLKTDAAIVTVGETFVLLPFAILAATLIRQDSEVALSTQDWLLLSGGGVVTGLPLLFFGIAAQRLPLSILGFFQYIAPSFQFLSAVLFFNEPLEPSRLIGFSFIWLALGIFLLGATRKTGNS